MRIQHNIMAMNSYRNLSGNNGALSKNLEKLSSGYRINRAGDDAAGLAISEKMRAQIAGLDQAQKNAQSGINLVKTAEGALTEVHDMLNRMVTLASQSANGTYTNTDREKLQAEIDALTAEIDRIADNSNFNGTKLLDGSLASEQAVANAVAPEDMPKAMVATGDTIKTQFTDATKHTATLTCSSMNTAGEFTVEYIDSDGATKSVSLAIEAGTGVNSAASAATLADKINNDETLSKMFEATVAAGVVTVTAKVAGEDSPYLKSVNAGTAGTTPTLANPVNGADSFITIGKDTAGAALTANELKDGATITLGDKTYEILADVSKVKEGNVAIKLGADVNDTIQNLVAAMKANGIESAEAVTNAGVASTTAAVNIKIGDLSEISAAQKGVAVESNTVGVNLENTIDKAGVYEVTATGASAAGTYTVTVEYLDAEGNKKSKDLNYEVATGAIGAADVSKAIVKAMKNDEELASLFDIKTVDGATPGTKDVVQLTAKDAGTDGARLIGMKNNEALTTNQLGDVKIKEEAKDAGLEIDVNVANINEGDTITVDGKTYQFVKNLSDAAEGNIGVLIDDSATAAADDDKLTAKNLSLALQNNGVEAKYDSSTGKISIKNDAIPEAEMEEVGGLQLQIGADAVETINVNVESMKAETLGIKDLNIGDVENANKAIETIKSAIEQVSVTRGNLGAIQNRLEHTINNLGVMEENIQDAESNIRDTDIADEMMAYTKNNILIQSAQAMLAQANQVPQGVLQLMG